MSTVPTNPTPETPASDKITSVGTAIVTALGLLTPIAELAAKAKGANNLVEPLEEGVNIAIAALQKLIAEHNLDLTFGELEAMRLQTTWPEGSTAPSTGEPPAQS